MFEEKTFWLTLLTLGLTTLLLKWVAYVFLYVLDTYPCLQQLLQTCLEEIPVLIIISL